MKLFFVLLTNINNLPPAKNVLLEFAKQKIPFQLITMYSSDLPETIKQNNQIVVYDLQPKATNNKIKALLNRLCRRNKLRKLIRQNVSSSDIIWTFTDYDAMEVGRLLLKHRHVMQIMELVKDIPYFDEIPFLKANIKKYAKKSELVIVPEYNRAFIQQAYWRLKETPFVIPNKPEINKKDLIINNINEETKATLNKIKNKKIVLYQGTFGYERKLDEFIKAVHSLGNDYCVVLMGSRTKDAVELIKKYPFVYFVPFIPSPYHLFFTSLAHIGIVTYSKFYGIKHFDPLNAMYCAPNKTFEYSYFGIPMIGNKIPGLEIPFEKYHCGLCADLNDNSIKEAILEIEKNYDSYSIGAKSYYQSFDMTKAVKEIITKLGL